MQERLMRKAMQYAQRAAEKGEVPVGAIIVKDGVIISSGYNKREQKKNALMHAELIAIDRACKKLSAWRLEDCELYVTLEPCPMCAGAIANARIKKVYFGAYDSKMGATGSVIDLSKYNFNHYFQAEGGILKEECAALLSDFFKKLRTRNERSEQNGQE